MCWEVLEWLHNWRLFKNGSAPWVSPSASYSTNGFVSLHYCGHTTAIWARHSPLERNAQSRSSLAPSTHPLRGSQDANWPRNCFYNLVFCHLLLFFFSPHSFPIVELVSAAKVKVEDTGWGVGGGSSARGRVFLEWNNKKCCLVTAVMYYYVHDFFNMHFSSSPSYLSLFICSSVANFHCLIGEGDMDDLWWLDLIFLHGNLRRVNATRCLSIYWTATWKSFSFVAKPILRGYSQYT
jgi:hypothetical protein